MIRVKNSVIKAAILDMDGVLWRSQTPLCDLFALFANFDKHSISVVLATNNGTNSISQYVDKLKGFGVTVDQSQVVTSTMAVSYLVKKHFPQGGPVYISGSQALIDTMAEYGFYHSKENPQAVVAGLSWDCNFESIKNTSLMIQKGLLFFFTNPDPTYPTPEGNVPGAGTLLAALETATGVKAMLAGKPLPFIFEVALERLKTLPSETIVVGDRLNTDIQGGYDAHCKTVFVLTGVNTREDLNNWSPQPDLIIDNIQDLFNIK
ncbi:MAG: HAD-IIA family hydrolase [Pelolinea sp.]|nr:HAD-IIA family hydrolase [Pelolinea sp.]